VDFGSVGIDFRGTWGKIELEGHATSTDSDDGSGTISIWDNVSITNYAYLRNDGNAYSNVIYNGSNAPLTLADGSVEAKSGNGMINAASSSVKVTGGKVTATTGMAIDNRSDGSITVEDGTVAVTSTGGIAIKNTADGPVTINGGVVSATSGIAIFNNAAGKILMTDGPTTRVPLSSRTIQRPRMKKILSLKSCLRSKAAR